MILLAFYILVPGRSGNNIQNIPSDSKSKFLIHYLTQKMSSIQYQSQDPIFINGNNNFNATASLEGWSGDGSLSDPYVIEDLDINGTGSGACIEIRNTNVYFHINNCILRSANYGILLGNVSNGIITFNVIHNNFYDGIWLVSSASKNIIKNNTIYSNDEFGVTLSSADNNVIENNSIENGLCFLYSQGNTIHNNDIKSKGLELWGDTIEEYSQAECSNNRINDKPIVLLKDKISGTISSDAGQVILVNCTFVEVANCSLSNLSIGLLLAFSSFINIYNNNITNNFVFGIHSDHSFNNTFTNNNIQKNIQEYLYGHATGINLENSNNNSFLNNNIVQNDVGIFSSYCSFNYYSYNNISHNFGSGIKISHDNNTLSHNFINNNGDEGIYLSRSSYNLIKNNEILNNDVAGIYLRSSPNNTVVDNNLTNNGLVVDGSTFDIEEYKLEYFLQINVSGNILNGKPIIFWQNKIGGELPLNAHQVILINCTAIEIKNNQLSNASVGLMLAYSSFINVYDNSIANNSWYSVFILSSHYSNFTKNDISDNLDTRGVWIINSSNNLFSNNSLSSNNVGITLDACTNNLFIENKINNQRLDAFYIRNSSYNEFIKNTIRGVRDTAFIFGENSSYNIINNNTISDAIMGWGITLGYDTSHNVIKWNDFINNTGPWFGNSQAHDSGINNIFLNNYWNEWTTPELDGDGFVDYPYAIDGTASNYDLFPLTQSYKEGNHYISYLRIVSPNGGEILNGSILIEWITAVDNLGHTITYNISYSSDGGSTWVEINSGITSTSYVWNTLTVEDGHTYFIRIIAICSTGLTYMDISDGKFTIQNHILTIPTIIYPNGGEILIGSITIQWESSNDNQGHAINYSIFFYNGSAWEILVEGLETNMYQWDTTYHSDGSDYTIAVITVCSEGYMAYDMSDDVFSILNSGTEPHTLSEPIILSPNGGETLTGIITTYWTPSIDSLGHDVTYSIFYSADGGTTWIPQSTGEMSGRLCSVHFIDENTGWSVGTNGTVLYTNDGGDNWNTQTSNTNANLESVSFADAQNGWAVGARFPGGKIVRTADGGATWTEQTVDERLISVCFVTAQSGWAVGENGILLKTTDGGLTW